MTAIATTTVGNWVTDPSGAPVASFEVDIRVVPIGSYEPNDANPETLYLMGAKYSVTAGVNGGWTVDLPQSAALPFTHYYEAHEKIPASLGGSRITAFCVPVSATCVSIQNHLYTPEPPGPPA